MASNKSKMFIPLVGVVTNCSKKKSFVIEWSFSLKGTGTYDSIRDLCCQSIPEALKSPPKYSCCWMGISYVTDGIFFSVYVYNTMLLVLGISKEDFIVF